jgi:two-component system OmpR family sensor kinase
MNPRGLRFRLGFGLSLIFVGVALWLLPWMAGVARTSAEQAHQELNRDVARAVVENSKLYENDQLNQEALQGVFMKLMAVNPTLELYLLDADGKILGYDAPAEKIKLEQVKIAPIQQFLADNGQVVRGENPRNPGTPSIFTAWPLENDNGYVYAVLASELYQAAGGMLALSDLLSRSAWILLGILVLAAGCSLLMVHMLTRDLENLQGTMADFRDGNSEARCRVRTQDEIGRLSAGFNYLADSVQEQMRKVQDSDRQRREMIASISHDLRTPLASLRGYLEHLDQHGRNLSIEEKEEILTIALRNTDRVRRMTDDLLELSRLEAGELRLTMEEFPLGELAHDVVQRFQPLAASADIDLQALVPQELPPIVGDIAMLERVLGNLVENAIRHTPAGGRVNLRLLPAPNGVEVRVIDNGEGIDAEELPRIFDRFYRIAKDRGLEEGSTGLGLAIVKQILALHKASIEVRSKPTVGSVFQFRLACGNNTS